MVQLDKERNMGIEALRVLSMLMICILHVIGIGGVLTGAQPRSMQYMTAWAMEAVAVCAVDCYALISGYVGASTKFKWSRVFKLWLEVLFYELLISVFFQIRFPEVMTGERWLAAFTPILSGEYWYISSYVGMFFFIPVLNAAVNNLSKRRLGQVLAAAFVIVTLMSTAFGLDVFGLLDGYCMLWLGILYLFGGYISKHVVVSGRKKWWLIPIFFVAAVLSWLSPMMGDARFIDYSSPTVLIGALAMLLFFANTEIKGKTVKKLVSILAPATLGVYIIHVHPLIFSHYLARCAKGIIDKPAPLMVVYVLLYAIGIFLVCSLADLVRIKVFKLLGVSKAVQYIDRLLAEKETDTAVK